MLNPNHPESYINSVLIKLVRFNLQGIDTCDPFSFFLNSDSMNFVVKIRKFLFHSASMDPYFQI